MSQAYVRWDPGQAREEIREIGASYGLGADLIAITLLVTKRLKA